MPNGFFHVPPPRNEPVLDYAPGSPERRVLREHLRRMSGQRIEIPARIGGKCVRTGSLATAVMPHDHAHVLADWHQCGPREVEQAVEAAVAAQPDWARMAWHDRAAIFLRAAELLAGPYRPILNAATMLGQSKTVHQAEIDAACELIDFWRFNVAYAEEIYRQQPSSSPGVWNRMEHRPLEGFVFAVTPFNFTSIAGNLPTAPAILGNVTIWKPASTALYSAHVIMDILEEAGLPPGVINLVPGSGRKVGDPALASRHFAGIHFTGSTEVFNGMWKTMAANVATYRSYPRIVGETGGKDFVFAHVSADVDALATALVRGAFEFQGQKCSAASRAFVPRSLWPAVRERLVEQVGQIRVGDVTDFGNFMGAVIDGAAFRSISGYIEHAESSPDAEIVVGGKRGDARGWFIEPTVVLARSPELKLMKEEIFGPVLTVWVYEDAELDGALAVCDQGSPYALTGAIFARDRRVIAHMTAALTHAAGNFYVNDKPTGAVVGQQPFGGGRASGTNDKAGGIQNLLRWVSPRSIKETFVPAVRFPYPFMSPDTPEEGAQEGAI